MRVRIKAALEEFKGGSAIAVVGFAAKLFFHPFKVLAKNVESSGEYGQRLPLKSSRAAPR